MAELAFYPEGLKVIDLAPGRQGPFVVFLCWWDVHRGNESVLFPIIHEMNREKSLHPIVVVWGGGLTYLEPHERKMLGLNPAHGLMDKAGSFLAAESSGLKPDVFVTDGTWPGHSLELFAREQFPHVPMIDVQGRYDRGDTLFGRFEELGHRLPKLACRIDQESCADLAAAYPQYEKPTARCVTGSPLLHRVCLEGVDDDVRGEYLRFRSRYDGITLADGHPIVTLIVPPEGGIEFVRALAQQLKEAGCTSPVYAARPHPSDGTPPEKYEAAVLRAGLRYLHGGNFSTETVATASNVVVSAGFTDDLARAALRGIPALSVARQIPRHPLPPVRMGAVLECDDFTDAALCVRELVRPDETEMRRVLYQQQKAFYAAHKTDPVPKILNAIVQAIRSPA